MPLDKPIKKYGACEPKELDEQRTLVRIDIYKSHPAGTIAFACCPNDKHPVICPAFLCCTQYITHSGAKVSLIKKGRSDTHYVSYGFRNANYNDMVEKFESHINKNEYAEIISLYGYANDGDQSFNEFVRQSMQQFPPNDPSQHDNFTHNCVHAAEHPIRFFGVNKHESTLQKVMRFLGKLLCGLCGTVCGIEACPTLPKLDTPAELYRYAKILSESDMQKKLREEAEKYNSEPPPSQRMI